MIPLEERQHATEVDKRVVYATPKSSNGHSRAQGYLSPIEVQCSRGPIDGTDQARPSRLWSSTERCRGPSTDDREAQTQSSVTEISGRSRKIVETLIFGKDRGDSNRCLDAI